MPIFFAIFPLPDVIPNYIGILALYSSGMGRRDIAEQIKELYDVEISPDLVSKISEKIMPEVTRLAEPSPGNGVSIRLHGRHPL